jgi:ribose transport system ATP-binding protein
VNDAIGAGIGLVPEDRKSQGLILNMNVAKNTSLANLTAFRHSVLSAKRKRRNSAKISLKS